MRRLPNSNSDTGDDTGDDTGVRPTEDRPPSTPRWVKVSGIIVIVLLLLYGILELTGVGGGHGPGQHTSSGGGGSQGQHTTPIDQGKQQP